MSSPLDLGNMAEIAIAANLAYLAFPAFGYETRLFHLYSKSEKQFKDASWPSSYRDDTAWKTIEHLRDGNNAYGKRSKRDHLFNFIIEWRVDRWLCIGLTITSLAIITLATFYSLPNHSNETILNTGLIALTAVVKHFGFEPLYLSFYTLLCCLLWPGIMSFWVWRRLENIDSKIKECLEQLETKHLNDNDDDLEVADSLVDSLSDKKNTPTIAYKELREVPGIGKPTERTLNSNNIKTVTQLIAATRDKKLQNILSEDNALRIQHSLNKAGMLKI